MTSAAPDRAKRKRERATGKLPAEGTQARRFGKTRSAQSTALLEDYVELIADLLASAGEARPTDIARRLGVSHATAVKTISRLKRAGLGDSAPVSRGIFDREGTGARRSRPRPPSARRRRALRAGRSDRIGRGGRRGNRTLRLGSDAEGVRSIPQVARVKLSFRGAAKRRARNPYSPALQNYLRSSFSKRVVMDSGLRPAAGPGMTIPLRRVVRQRVDDAVDDFLDQRLVVAFPHDADHRLRSRRPHHEPPVAVEALFRIFDRRLHL